MNNPVNFKEWSKQFDGVKTSDLIEVMNIMAREKDEERKVLMNSKGDRDYASLKKHRLYPRTLNEILACAKATFEDPRVKSVVIQTEWGFAKVGPDNYVKVVDGPEGE